MVNIRRPARQKSSSLVSVRSVITLLVTVLGVRMFINLIQTTTTTPAGSTADAGHFRPMGVKDHLDSSGMHRIPKKPKSDPTPRIRKTDRPPVPAVKNDPEPSSPKDDPEEKNIPDMPDEDQEGNPLEIVPDPDLPAHDTNPSQGSPLNVIVVEKKGTGPTKVGYVKDFIDERDHPEFRKVAIEAKDASPSVASQVKETSVAPCVTQGPDGKPQTKTQCLDADTPLIAYNSAPFTRSWCGKEIPASKAVLMEEHCNPTDTVHMFPMEQASLSGHGMPAIIIKSHSDIEVSDSELETVECDVPCSQEKGMEGSMRYIDGESWTVFQTMEDAYFNGNAKIERTKFRQDYYYSTQSFQSSVVLTNYDPARFSLRNRPPIDFETAKPKAVYMVSSRCASNGSKLHKYFGAVKAAMNVDSYGTCGHNIDVPDGMSLDKSEDRIALMKEYRMVLAFDSSPEKDHISEMVWEAMISGAVPVLVGADNMREHLPPKSFIWAGDFSHWDELAKAVKEISEDKTKWESYHSWRTDDAVIAAVEAKYEFSKTGPTCRLCRWAYAKKYGLGWDHAKQQVKESVLPSNLCVSPEKGLIVKPFGEEWVHRKGQDESILKRSEEDTEMCNGMKDDGMIDFDSFKVHRTVVQHDGVTDIMISSVERDSTDGEVVMRFSLPGIRNSEGAHFRSSHTTVPTTRGPLISSASVQDELSKITVLADWATTVSSPQEGMMEVVIQATGEGPIEKTAPRRIRVISKGFDPVNEKMTEFFPSSFETKMIKDFVDPLELFFANS